MREREEDCVQLVMRGSLDLASSFTSSESTADHHQDAVISHEEDKTLSELRDTSAGGQCTVAPGDRLWLIMHLSGLWYLAGDQWAQHNTQLRHGAVQEWISDDESWFIVGRGTSVNVLIGGRARRPKIEIERPGSTSCRSGNSTGRDRSLRSVPTSAVSTQARRAR